MPLTPKKYMNEVETQDLIFKIREALEAKPKIVTWADGTDEEIVALIEALDDGTYTTEDLGWDVGDERVVSLNALAAGDFNVAHAAQDVTLVIYEVDNYNGVGHYIVGFKDCLNETEKMEETSTNANGWHNSRGRKCCDELFNMIPSSLQPIFKTFTVTTATKGNSTSPGTTDQSGKLALLAEKELFETRHYTSKDEFDSSKVHSQLEWFKTQANRIKYVNGSANFWWERSPVSNQSRYFIYVTKSGSYYTELSNNSYGFSPFGVI